MNFFIRTLLVCYFLTSFPGIAMEDVDESTYPYSLSSTSENKRIKENELWAELVQAGFIDRWQSMPSKATTRERDAQETSFFIDVVKFWEKTAKNITNEELNKRLNFAICKLASWKITQAKL